MSTNPLRRSLLLAGASGLAAACTPKLGPGAALAAGAPNTDRSHLKEEQFMNTIVTKDGTRLYYKDWGAGPVVVFSHGWPLSSDSWESQMLYLAERGYRCVAHDRRGHGRSSQPWNGNDMNTYAEERWRATSAATARSAWPRRP
jgi:non-heme chloroperoxidase